MSRVAMALSTLLLACASTFAQPGEPPTWESLVAELEAHPPDLGPLDGEIAGSVMDEFGLPIANVPVVARPRPEVPNSLEPGEVLRTAALNWWKTAKLSRRGVADSEGRFRLDGIGTGEYELLGDGGAFEIYPIFEEGQTSFRAGVEALVVALRTTALTIEAVGHDGQAVPSCEVRVTDTEFGFSSVHAWSPTEPTLRVPGTGAVIVSAKAGRWVSSEVTVNLEPGGATSVELSVTWGGLYGSVVDELGRPIEDCDLYLVAGDERPTPESLRQKTWFGSAPAAPSFTPTQGRYERRFQKPGKYWLVATRLRNHLELVTVVEVDGWTRYDFVLPTPTHPDARLLRVSDPAGRPVPGVELRPDKFFFAPRDEAKRMGPPRMLPGGLLSYEIPPAAYEAAFRNSIPHELKVTAVGYGDGFAPISKTSSGTIEVRLTPVSLVEVVVEGCPPELSNRLVVVHDRQGSREEPVALRAGEPCQLPAIGASPSSDGRRDVQVCVGVLEGQHFIPLVWENLHLEPGNQQVTLTVPELHDVTIEFGSIYASQHVYLDFPGLDHEVIALVGSDGRLELPRIPAGELQIRSDVFSIGVQSLIVDRDLSVPYQPKQANALRLVLPRRDHSVYSQGFRDGDLIIEVNGREFAQTIEQVTAWLHLGAKKTLTVLRGDERLTLEMAFEGLQVLMSSREPRLLSLRPTYYEGAGQ